MKKTFIFMMALVCATFVACNKQDATLVECETFNISNDENTDVFAQILSASLRNPEMHEYIIGAVNEEFDGDSNFLIAEKSREVETKSGNTFYGLLRTSYMTKSSSSNMLDLDKIIYNIQQYDPLLQVYVMNQDLWNNGVTPIVVWLPEDFDDQVVCTLTGYDVNGAKLSIASDVEITDKAVVVLSRNERTIIVEKEDADKDGRYLGALPYYSNDEYNFYLKEDLHYPVQVLATYDVDVLTKSTTILDDKETALAWGGDYATCDRYDSYPTVEYISKVTIADRAAWKELESMWNGDPDLKVFVINAVKTPTSITVTAEEKHIGKGYGNRYNISWKSVDLALHKWSLASHGNTMKYEWFDDDSGKNVTVNKKFTTDFYSYGTLPERDVPMTVQKRDEYAGGAYVYYWQDWKREYSTGIVKFEIESKK